MLTTSSREPDKTPVQRAMDALALAFAFLTILPTWPLTADPTDDDIRASRFAFPVVGLALGLLLAAVSGLLQRCGAPSTVTAFLLISTLAALTGGLHLDGLADTGDGLFLGGNPSRRLEVMRDPRVGSYGVTMIVLSLLGKYAALTAFTGSARSWSLLGALAVSRSMILVSAGHAPYARPEGTGRLLVEATHASEALAAAAFALLVASLSAHVAGLVASLTALGITLSLTALAKRRLGGVTGDILGALVELSEMGYLVCLSCFF